ncbi:hypothetical protein [Parasediminibacterium sp. JCM 36343]|uniref:hypothetical protein n=1 Tax=Parasediminibacterium sp. JCM 36343 TaxID=3374279 RepID=UPI003978F7D0
MKKIIVVASALFLVAVTNAQTDSTQARQHHHMNRGDMKGKGGHGEVHKDMITKDWKHHGMHAPKLNLTDDQKQQSKTIKEDYDKKIAALYDNDKMKLGDFKKKSASLRKERKEKLDGVLTADQKSKLDDFKKKRVEEMQARSAARLEKMKTKLGLKDDQVATIKSSQDAFHEKMKAIHEDETLLPEQKKEKIKALMMQQKDAFKSVLTQDQLDKIESFKKQREGKR